eukprot:CAMPEP_0202713556 /NCGR_PEP_ID=MMETSP1385-20130828/56067_1 /ASSEMBLY_ACC=CAM_ASM_000861 /TAXON_ID=933848 /ORGANISM="Elphidium margaritaceum" /LENGTH=199 /DNA_ID=CAMNT_0049373945 /DNA_START=24 /DNA_END=623 /DNA_ORIENTATION=+
MSRFSRIFKQFTRYTFPASFVGYNAAALSHTSLDNNSEVKNDEDEECETPICHDANEAIKEYSDFFKGSSKSRTSFMMPPPDRQQLGRHSWTLLHSMAAYWPNHPSDEQKQNMISFLHLLSEVYPCQICASDLKHELEQHPPNVDSRDEFIEWMCKLHNRISKKIHKKQQFDCKQHQKRWRRQRDHTWHDIEELDESEQ